MNEAGLSAAAFAAFPEPIAVVGADVAPTVRESNASWASAFADGTAILAAPAVADALSKVLSGQSTRAETMFVGTNDVHTIVIVPMTTGSERSAALVHARPAPRMAAPVSENDTALL